MQIMWNEVACNWGWSYELRKIFIGGIGWKSNGCNYPSSTLENEEIGREKIKGRKIEGEKVQLGSIGSIWFYWVQFNSYMINLVHLGSIDSIVEGMESI